MPAVRSDAEGNRRTSIGSPASAIRPRSRSSVWFESWSEWPLAVEDGAELRRIDVAARDYTDNIPRAGLPCHGGRHRRRARRLGNDVMPAGQETNRLGNLGE